jgi:hypothetical protein
MSDSVRFGLGLILLGTLGGERVGVDIFGMVKK